jgi:hypothetical protein
MTYNRFVKEYLTKEVIKETETGFSHAGADDFTGV